MAEQQTTEPTDDVEESKTLPVLSPKAYQFACNIALKGMSQYQAYCEAYDVESTRRNTADVEACRLKKNPKVAAWINHLRVHSAKLSVEQHLADLRDLRDRALAMGNPSAAITAESLRGKVSRLYVEQVEISDAQKADTNELAKLAAGGDAEVEKRLKDQLAGIPRRVH